MSRWLQKLSRALTVCLSVVLLVTPPALAGSEDRYVVIGGAVAEIFAALAPNGKVVGVDAGVDAVGPFENVPVIRGFRLTSAENLLSLRPTVVFIAARRTTPELLRQLEATGVQIEVFEYTKDLPDVKRRIVRLGQLLDREEAAARLSAQVTEDWARALAESANVADRPGGFFVLSGGGRGNLAGGSDTLAAYLIEMAGGTNLTTMITGHKPLSQEAMAALAPQFIITNMEGLDLEDGAVPLLAAPGIQLTPAYRDGALIAVPNGMLTEAGMRTPGAIRFLVAKFATLGQAR